MRSLACLLLALALAPAANADEPEHHHHHHKPAPSKAQTHIDQGVELEGQGEFEMAIMEFEAAQAIEKSPENASHIAECQEALAKIPEAIATYLRYLDEAGDAPEAAAIKKHVVDLQIQLHTGEAKRFLDGQEFEKALHELEEAEKVRHEPRRLYEIATCLEGMNENLRAAESYRAYLKEAPDAADAGEIDGRIKILTGHRMEAPPPPKDALAPPPPPLKWYVNRPAWGLTIGGGLLAAGALTFFGLSRSSLSDADAAHAEADFNTLYDRGHTFNWVAISLGVVAGAAVVAAAVLFVRHARERPIAPAATVIGGQP